MTLSIRFRAVSDDDRRSISHFSLEIFHLPFRPGTCRKNAREAAFVLNPAILTAGFEHRRSEMANEKSQMRNGK
jgi:hypothetical protein